jgi:HEPN domain-containing protein
MTPQREEAERLLRLARRDRAAFLVLRDASHVDPAVACFHAQQSAEKALKAVMCLYELEYRRTHDLEELAGQLADAGNSPPVSELELRRLTPYAVEFRYDDEAVHLMSCDEAGGLVDSLLAWASGKIGKQDQAEDTPPTNHDPDKQ